MGPLLHTHWHPEVLWSLQNRGLKGGFKVHRRGGVGQTQCPAGPGVGVGGCGEGEGGEEGAGPWPLQLQYLVGGGRVNARVPGEPWGVVGEEMLLFGAATTISEMVTQAAGSRRLVAGAGGAGVGVSGV